MRFLFIYLLIMGNLFALEIEEEEKFLLVTGCARSGTRYTALLFSECGLDIQHEKMGRDGISCWTMAVKYQRSPWGPPVNCYKFKHIFHQVRDPLLTIASVYVCETNSWNFICQHIPEIDRKDSLLVKSAKYWYYWNLKTEEIAEITYRVEDIDQVLPELGMLLDFSFDSSFLQEIPKNINHRNGALHLTWDDLKHELPSDLYEKIISLSKHYGYIPRAAQNSKFRLCQSPGVE